MVPIPIRRINTRRSVRRQKLPNSRRLRKSLYTTVKTLTNNTISRGTKTYTPMNTRENLQRTTKVSLRPLHRTITRGASINGVATIRNNNTIRHNRPRVRNNKPNENNLRNRPPHKHMTSNIPLTTLRLLLRSNQTLRNNETLLPIRILPRRTCNTRRSRRRRRPNGNGDPTPTLTRSTTTMFLVVNRGGAQLSLYSLPSLCDAQQNHTDKPYCFATTSTL